MLDLQTIERDRAERRAYWRAQGVMTTPGADVSLASVSAYFRGLGITRQKIPERFILLEEDFPRAPSGKIKKADLRARFRAEHAEPAE